MLSMKTIIMTSLLLANSSVFALQVLNDDSLSQTTGQDGITITLKDFGARAQIAWTDTNGINTSNGINPLAYGINAAPQAGSVVFGDGTSSGNFRLSTGDTIFTIDADGYNGAAVLNIGIKLPENLVVNTGNVYVAGKTGGKLANSTKIMNDMKVELGSITANIQLGNSPQGNFVNLSGTITDGLRISDIGIIGATSGANEYGLGVKKLTIRDSNAANLTLDGTGINVTNAGLVITPSASKQVDVLMQDVRMGNLSNGSAAIGGIALLGLQLGGTALTISGH